MIRHSIWKRLALTLALVLVVVACGDSASTETTQAATTQATTASDDATTTAAGSETTDPPATTEAPMEVVNLRFFTVAWQEESIAANQELVDEWNAANPSIQVEYVQGSWDTVHDELLTGFVSGESPDLLHYESTPILDFGRDGYVVDLRTVLSDDFIASIRQGAWDTSTDNDGAIYGVPFLQESSLFFANKTLFDVAGIELPTIDNPWTWDEFEAAARAMTGGDVTGVAFPFRSPTNRILNLSLAFDGGYFETADGVSTVKFGDAEKEVVTRIAAMLADGSAAKDSLGFGSSDVLPGFFGGQYAMVTSGVWFRQQISSQAPDGFDWVTLPPLLGTSQNQGSGSQTVSIAVDSPHPEEAAQFLEFLLSADGMARLAKGDWLLPTSDGAAAALDALTGGADGWDVAVESGAHLINAPFQAVSGFSEWKSTIANPAFSEFFNGIIDLAELERILVEDGQKVLDGA